MAAGDQTISGIVFRIVLLVSAQITSVDEHVTYGVLPMG